MTNSEIKQKADKIASHVSNRQLKNAFEEIRMLATEINDWNISAELDNMEKTYKYMLQYMLSGANDPDREKVYNKLLKSTYNLTDKVIYLLQEKYGRGYYFENKRSTAVSLAPGSQSIADALQDVTTRISLSDLLEETDSTVSVNHQKNLEKYATLLFKSIWLNCDLSDEERNIILDVLRNNNIPVPYRALLISSLLLSLKECFDEKKILLLQDACEIEEEQIRQRALVALMLALYDYDERMPAYPSVTNRLNSMAEDPLFAKNIHTLIKQFILTKETEKITKKINEELLPEMMKISPKISGKINLSELMDADNLDDKNPEWQDLFEEAGLTDKLQEMNDLQMEGADVMHSSFSNLKGFPFFYEISNWFLPFYHRHSSLADSGLEAPDMESFHDISYICNSDKYSLCFSLRQMPDQYRNTVLKQMLAETAEFLKQNKQDELVPQNKLRETVSNQYIHDLYRFYKVYPKRFEFKDVFASPLAFYKTETIGKLIVDEKLLLSIGEYYFSKNQYEDALYIFDKLTGKGLDDSVLYQKTAFCKQMNNRMDEALNDYLKAELISPNHTWTLLKIAYCYRMLKQPKEALGYYRRVEEMKPDSLSVQLNIGHCYLELKQYQEALKTYFKVEYLNGNSRKSWLPIAWCSFLTGKFEQAVGYYKKIIDHQPKMSDHLNYGHALLAMKDIKGAIAQYKLAMLVEGSSKDKFLEAFNADIPELVQAGIKQNDLPIILDQLLYSAED